jgi:hypothetical protein
MQSDGHRPLKGSVLALNNHINFYNFFLKKLKLKRGKWGGKYPMVLLVRNSDF